MQLDVKKIIQPILTNYNEHVVQFARLLHKISFTLVYLGPSDLRVHIRDKTVYACSVKNHCKSKMVRSIFPVMIGSRLDTCIRKLGMTVFTEESLLSTAEEELPFDTADIAITLFLINGSVKHLPYFFTNDPTNCHVVANSYVCCYTYDAEDRGKKLSLYVDNWEKKYTRGDIVVSLNDGTENTHVESFFDQCPYPVRQDVYMTKIFREGSFDIDHLANKIVVSPGHLFVRLFMKYLYQPLRDKNWSAVKAKATMIVKSIELGTLLHVLSRKTAFQSESNSTAKMVQTPTETHRELGMNGEVYVEKNSGCYREVKMQTYPLIPYMSHLIVRQISSKVKTIHPYHDSYIGFLCYLGILEMKNIGRTHMMVRNTYVSTREDLPTLFETLALECCSDGDYYVVVNEACIPVTEQCFRRISLEQLKAQFVYIECYRDPRFIYIRYKVGLLFKWMQRVWVTSRDELYWAQHLFHLPTKDDIINKFGYDYLIGHHVDLNPYFHHNMFAKNILGFNALKNAILATDRRYSIYFMETLSGYAKVTPYHEVVCEPVDVYSRHFALYLPRVVVGYMSLDGNNQEDCIAVRGDLDAFDSYRFYTIRVKMELEKSAEAKVVYYPVRGRSEDDFLGDLICHCSKMTVVSQSIYARVVKVNDFHVKLFFDRSYSIILNYHLTNDRLIISMEQLHPCGMGDKLCSFHGQKGVLRKTEKMPLFDEIVPDLLVNPYCITTRLTGGQIQEQMRDCRDAQVLRNSEGKLLIGQSALYGKAFYFAIAYFSSEHIYIPTHCNFDKILGQPVKGRSRKGGMKLGNMEIMNGMRGNGIASCFEEKVFEHGDRIFHEIPIPKSVSLCTEDAKVYKFNMTYETEPCITEE